MLSSALRAKLLSKLAAGGEASLVLVSGRQQDQTAASFDKTWKLGRTPRRPMAGGAPEKPLSEIRRCLLRIGNLTASCRGRRLACRDCWKAIESPTSGRDADSPQQVGE